MMVDERYSSESTLAEQPGAPTPDRNAVTAGELFVVGVGASAGGLEALERLFEGVRPTGRLAFVVVQHLSPDFRSLMDELLARHTRLAVHRAEDGMAVEPDGVYLLPPRKEIRIASGRLQLRDRDLEGGLALPIDTFFASLAQEAGRRAVAVVLSGTGSDGSRGLRAVHEAGGLVLAQSEDSAKFDGMPRAAAETGLVDLQLPPEELAGVLIRYGESGGTLQPPLLAPSGDAMKRILQLLRKETGVDFSGYKPSTVGRRIERRLVMSESKDLDRYLDRIESDPEELRSLYKDLLIGVTRFFRDPEAFEVLRRDVLRPAVERLAPGEELRVWVPACATGEEPFSIAILAHELFRARGMTPSLKVFATDIHRASLDAASAGVYPRDAMVHVPPELRERYFARCGDDLQVAQELRSCVVFAHHNVLRDAPFTRLDLVSCRNFLIYLTPAPQQRVISLFHFALKAGGALFLGPSETPGAIAEEFSVLDGRWKVFRKRRDVRLAGDVPAPTALDLSRRVVRSRAVEEDARLRAAREALVTRYAPPALLVDEAFTVLHAFNGAARFLLPRDGAPSLNLLDLLTGELKFVVGAAVKRVQKERVAVEYGAVTTSHPTAGERIRVCVAPAEAKGSGELGLLVTLEPEGARPPASPPAPAPIAPDLGALESERTAALELELRHAKENLQATVEEMETSNEELQATNEELIASNEELQSTNEELHSVNEELYTVNAEYQAKIAELTELTADMNHLLESTQVHTLFLDRALRLRKFTPRMGELFNLIPGDLGRRIEGFAHELDHQGLMEDLAAVLATGEPLVRETADRRGAPFLLRILPYRPGQNVDGVVLTLVDVAALKRAQADLAEERRISEASTREALARRDQLLAMLSHELRTPLGAVVNAAELIGLENVTAEKRQACLSVIRRQARHMAAMLDDLLDVARLTRDQLTLRTAPADLTAIVRETGEALRPDADRKGLTLTVHVPAAPVPVVGDPGRLQQVVANLVSNAIRYTPQGAVEVVLEALAAGPRVSVRDTGVGMAPEELARVFELFYQAPQSSDRASGGLGVGLHLAQRLAALHGGALSASSPGKGQGSTFVLELPPAEATSTAPEPRPASRAKLRLCIVEDNEDIRETLRDIFELAGHQVTTAPDGSTGLQLILETRPDVALVDLGLPGLDGIGVAREVRARIDHAVRLVALTGYGSSEDRERTRAAGFDAHVLKPVDPDELLAQVAEVAARRPRPTAESGG